MKLSVVIPIYNEEGNIELLFDRLSKSLADLDAEKEYLFINDGSKDGSLELIKRLEKKHPDVRYIDFSRNFGHQLAVTAGLDHCSGDAAVIIDADLQDPPELIPQLYDRWKEGYQVVYAQRNTRSGEPVWRLAAIKSFYRILSWITDIDIPLNTGDFRLIDRKIIDILKEMPERNKYLRGQIAWMGFNQTAVTYERDPRHSGETGYPFKKLLKLALDGITGFSDFPLKMVTYFGFIVSFIAFLLIIYAFWSRYVYEYNTPGWASLMVTILFLGGVQMIALGVIGEYLSRINRNARSRPTYIIREKK